MNRILIADPDHDTRAWLKPVLQRISSEIEEVGCGNTLERALLEDGSFDLVVTNAKLPGQSGLQVLARVRSAGLTVPFIVVTSIHQYLLRIFVSEAEGTVLSSRMVDGDNLVTLAKTLLRNVD